MRNLIRFVCVHLIFIGFLSFPLLTYAHFAATDGNITITMHVDPNDAPIPGKTAYLYFLFAFNDPAKKFHLNECNCIVAVSRQGKQIFQQRLMDTNNPHRSVWGADLPFVFPAKDIYLITLQGSPITPNAFKPFSLTWPFTFDQNTQKQVTADNSDPSFVYFVIGFFSIILLTGLGVLLVYTFSSRRK